jgi:hypothetical protein
MQDAFRAAREAVLQLAAAEALPSRSFACTLICAVATQDWLAVCQVGDGAAVALENGTYGVLVEPQRGEYASDTFFITMDNAAPAVCARLMSVESLALTTDGLVRLAMAPGSQPHPPFFKPLFDFALSAGEDAPQQLAGFMSSERVCARTDDDKTLVLAVRRPQ